MIGISSVFSVLLLTAGGCAIAGCLYANQGTVRPLPNKLLVCVTCSLVLWSFGLALRVSAADRHVAVIGSLIAPVGYGMLFGFLLHYVLALTGRAAKLGWARVCLIYLPGILSVAGLSLLPLLGRSALVLVPTRLGWVNDTRNFWLWYYYAYYAVFLALTCWLLLRWAGQSGPGKVRNQARVLLCSILAMAVLGTLTDAAPVFFHVQFPGIAVLFGVLPILSVCYSVRYLHFMRPKVPHPDELILNEATRVKSIYRLVSVCFLIGVALVLLSQIALHGETNRAGTLAFSGLLLAAGLAVFLLGRFVHDDGGKELALSVVFALFIPVILFYFAQYGSITIWPFSILLVVPSMLFNQRVLLLTVLFTQILTQFVLMGITPEAYVRVDGSDYIIRIGLILLTGCLCVFVSRIYHRRLVENLLHTRRQTAASAISRTLLSAGRANQEEAFQLVLEQCGTYLECDRACLCLLEGGGDSIRALYEWTSRPGSPADSLPETEKTRLLLDMISRMDGVEPLILSGSALPASLRALPGTEHPAALHTLIAAPVLRQGAVTGTLCVGFGRAAANGADLLPAQFLQIASNMLSDTLMKLESLSRLRYIAYHDQLTGLSNRLMLTDRLKQAMALADRTSKMTGLVFLDLDSFKAVNDTMGHELGDRLLVQMAASLSGCVRKYDTVARLGGDEFVVVLNQISGVSDLLSIVEKLMASIRRPVTLQGQEFFMTGSAGVALYPQDGTEVEELIANADIAMYHAKNLGKNQYALCSQDMKDEILGRMKLTNQLYRALELRQLSVYYQPQIDLRDRQITGLEALLRWTLPDGTMVSPSVFIPLAEKAGLIQSIGTWVLETACRQGKRWQEAGFAPVRISVNVSIQQLVTGNFCEQVAQVLRETRFPPELLELEVTESIASCGSPWVSRTFARLKEMGVSLSIDDFGTQYSSLNRLKVLPVDRLKLDMQFVRGIESSEKDRAITTTIIALAKSLKIRIVAEGVETGTQLAFLNQRLCDEVQGFYCYRPMPPGEVERYLPRAAEASL